MQEKKHELINHKTKKHQKRDEIYSFDDLEVKSSACLKKKIRDLERLVKKGAIPENVQVEIERRIHSLHFDLKTARELKKKHTLKGKYKMVRFFEMKKASRYLKQAQKQLMEACDENEKKRLQEIVHHCQVDLDYVVEFPSLKKYISLYKSPSENSSTAQERIMIWKNIEKKKIEKDKMYQIQ
ncbi:hypothetical protein PCANB_002895 [Pneumocystis canis]|nr:hypothetical protein PCK1_002912 [Pneumocystis canis]KAG5438406.1 hypothetical protein PCANB_002895 [Pneumocystis canis]